MENWLHFFKNYEFNNKNEIFYNLDYQNVGNLYERVKYLYPSDNSIISCLRYNYQEKFHYRLLFNISLNKIIFF